MVQSLTARGADPVTPGVAAQPRHHPPARRFRVGLGAYDGSGVLRRTGVPSVVADAVEALTHRPNEPRADYLTRVKADPHALAVKLADNADNSDEARLALLDPSLAERYRTKYAADRRRLLDP